ncbi:hypothetical protein M0R72_02900 [Candidatus Pacearchaeota archaeon]|jgi:hypothetical protein|nr:hypothetical protein [Candidatus Pacearchaeota archaeon]
MLLATEVITKETYRFDEYETCDGSIFPSDIEKIIRAGLARGWNSAEGHGTFHPGNVKLEQYTMTEKEPDKHS